MKDWPEYLKLTVRETQGASRCPLIPYEIVER